MTRVGEATEQLGAAASDLEASSARIGQISAMLKDTADRINLLALNAAIEAARAGTPAGVRGGGRRGPQACRSTQVRLVESSAAVDEMQRSIDLVRNAGEVTTREVRELVSATEEVGSRFSRRSAPPPPPPARRWRTSPRPSEEVAAAAGETGRRPPRWRTWPRT